MLRNTVARVFTVFAFLLLISPFSTHALITSTLKVGAKGPEVTELQKILSEQGYFTNEITGYFGNLTKYALMQYQRANAETVSGVTTQSTRYRLNSTRPTLTLSATDRTIPYNTQTTISWTSTNTTSCTFSSGQTGTSGSFVTDLLTITTTYTVTCIGDTGTITKSAVIRVGSQPKTTVVIDGVCGPTDGTTVDTRPTSGFCSKGTMFNLAGSGPWTWNCSGKNGGVTASCSAQKAATSTPTPTPINGICGSSNNTTVSTAPTTNLCSTGTASSVSGSGPWSWTCAGSNGGATASCTAQKTVVVTPAPTATLTASASSLAYNTATNISWSSTNATNCTLSSGQSGTSGSFSTGPLTTATTYTLTCTGAGGSASKSVTVGVLPAPVTGTCGTSNGQTLSSVPTTNLCSTGTASAVTGSGPWSWTCAGSNGGGSATCTAQKVFVDTTAPSTPTGLTATPASTSAINLTWSPSTDNIGVTGYKVYRGGTQIATTTTTTYSNTGLIASTAYTYTVAAYDAQGNTSVQSTGVSATTQAALTPVTGTCGTSNGQTLSSVPTTNLCSTGTASSVSGSGPWSWTCAGSNGGGSATCTANTLISTTPSTYYVAVNGNDVTGNGSINSPYATIKKAVSVMKGGETVVVRNGTYENRDGMMINDFASKQGTTSPANLIPFIPSGTKTLFTTIKAESPYGVRLKWTSNLSYWDAPVLISKAQYVNVDGFIYEVLNSEYPSYIVQIDSTNNKITRTIVKRNMVDEYGGWYGVFGSNNLIEDGAGVGAARYGFNAGGPDSTQSQVIFRRVIGRMDFANTYQPKATFSIYGNNGNANVHDIILQNAIAIDGKNPSPGVTEQKYGGFYNPKNATNVSIVGSIVLNEAVGHAGIFSQEQNGTGNSVKDTVIWDLATGSTNGAVAIRAGIAANAPVSNITIGGKLPGGNFTNITTPANSLINGSPTQILNNTPGALVMNKTGVSGTFWGDPGYNTVTSESLWPWPYEDQIALVFKEQMDTPVGGQTQYRPGYSPAGNVSNRGFVTKGLTRYIWEYLGTPCPSNICPGGTVSTPTPITGTCGSSNNTTVSTIPTTGLCSTGTASSVTGSGPWTWTCSGLNGGTTASCSANITVTTVAKTLTVSTVGSGTVTSSGGSINCGTVCTTTVNNNTATTLTATPSAGYTFTGWSGGTCSGTVNTCSFTIDGPKSVTATFTLTPPKTLTVSTVGSGTVTSSGGSINCGTVCTTTVNNNTATTLTAIPSAGYTFTGWSGGTCSGTVNTCLFTIDGPKSVTATFTANAVTPTVSTGAPMILYTDILSGPNTGGENNKGIYLSVFGKNFGTTGLGTTVKMYIGGVEVDNYRYLGASKGRSDIQQITAQIGNLPGLVSGGTYPVTVSVNGVTSNTNNSFTITPGNIYFVDNVNGVDTTDTSTGGTFTAPFKTVQKKAGSTLYFSIDSASVSGAWGRVKAGDFIVMRGKGVPYTDRGYYDYFFQAMNKSGSAPGTAPVCAGCTGSGPITIMGYPTEDVFINDVYASNIDTGAISSADSARVADGKGSWITITGLRIESGNHDGPINTQYGGSHWRIVNNELSAATAVNNLTAKAGGIAGHGTGQYFVGNNIHDIYCGPDNGNSNLENHGIYIDGPGSYEVAYNTFTKIRGGNGFQVYSVTASTNAGNLVNDINLHHNIFQNIAKHGINFAEGSSGNIRVWNNIVSGTDMYGLRFNSLDLNGAKVYNNTFYNIVIPGTPGTGYNGLVVNTWGPITTTQLSVQNNIFQPRASSVYYVSGDFASGVFSNNLYYGGINTLPTGDTSAVTANPLFVTAGSDFHLQSTSPAINKGSAAVSGVVTNDYDITTSRPQGGSYDIGAYER